MMEAFLERLHGDGGDIGAQQGSLDHMVGRAHRSQTVNSKLFFSQTMVFTCDKALYHNWVTKPARHFTDPSSHAFATRSQSASKAAMPASVSG